ncbi:ComEC/Rec2 family competence protein [Evansella cellulosilytica]|uniref:Hydrolase (Metallo-beta-lactamase superfamily) n=1 Tax=Evansella cellulosilytica (strain ATCC 21833 / DSM 2522 / FERM P-1141 / JCM 9156 / N-4) TaxID=649639 RepID=E6TZJ6_EVAC2|nr:hydrolase [Evansella cellulosilytica]ADU30170.1 hydrolase (metallo-beta-lactamase superfamily) [Evansella cellulosilytica DSM 2522]
MKKQLFSLMILTIFVVLYTPLVAFADKVDLNLSEGEIAYTFFDLSHGESTLIQGDSGETILLNTGHGQSEDDLEDRLDMYKVDVIDTLIISSKEMEYIGNLPYIINNFHVKNIVIPFTLKSMFESVLSNFNGEVTYVEKGDHFSLLEDVTVEVLYVEESEGVGKGGCALFIDHFNKSLLYMTIADYGVEESLVEEYDLKATMFKVPDFGSDRGTSAPLLEEVDPQIAVIFRNGEDEPSNFVLERLNETWIDIYQTSRIGTITVRCNKEDYEIITVRPSHKNSLPSSWLTFD